jgi:hypothetical protein
MTTPGPRHDEGDDVSDKRRRCFVISPIGEEGSAVRVHADDILEFIIKPALARCDVVPVRSDQMPESGTITDQMFREIVNADVCVVLLTASYQSLQKSIAELRIVLPTVPGRVVATRTSRLYREHAAAELGLKALP